MNAIPKRKLKTPDQTETKAKLKTPGQENHKALFGDPIFDLLPPKVIERRDRIWRKCWIKYPVGEMGLRLLKKNITHPVTDRPPCTLIIGKPNNGKTSLAKRFEVACNPPDKPDCEEKVMPVVYVNAPPGPDAGAFYSNILRKTGAPYAASWQRRRREEKVMNLLPNLGTRMVIIDELHNVLAGSARQRDYFLNMLKFMNNDLGLSIVGIGTDEVRSAVKYNPQMKSRFDEFVMPEWQVDKEYFSFLVQICKRVELKDLKFLEDGNFVRRVHTLSEGLTGGTWKVMGKFLEYVEKNPKSKMNVETLLKSR